MSWMRLVPSKRMVRIGRCGRSRLSGRRSSRREEKKKKKKKKKKKGKCG